MADNEGLIISTATPLWEIMIRNVLTVQVTDPVSTVDKIGRAHV